MKKQTKIHQTVLQQLTLLKSMDTEALHAKWRELFGVEPPHYKNHFLVRRLAWRIQEMYFGGLSQAAQEAMSTLIANDPIATASAAISAQANAKLTPVMGTRFLRVWKGE